MTITTPSDADVNAQGIENEGTIDNSDVNNSDKDYAQEAKNKAIALKLKKEENAQMKARLEELEAKERERIEAEKKKKGKYEELLTEKETTIKTLQEQLDELMPIKTKFEETLATQLDTHLKKIPESDREFVQSLMEGKPYEQRLEIAERMAGKFAQSYDPRTSSQTDNIVWLTLLTGSDFQKLPSEKKKAYMKASIDKYWEVKFET